MYQVFLCDDEPKFLSDLAEKVRQVLPDSEITTYSDGVRLLEALSDAGCDILLLDIDMPGLNGLDIAGQLSHPTQQVDQKPLLIFVTSHDELVYDSLQFHPFGFVRKGHVDSELPRVLQDSVHELSGHERHFCFHAANADVKLPLDEILYFESEGNYIRLYADTGEYRFRDTLSAIENALSDSGFVRIHKGFLVNQAAVRRLTSEEADLRNGVKLAIGRTYSEAARRRLMRYMMK